MTDQTIRDEIAEATHARRDHAIDGTPLGEEPVCNCYEYADALLPLLNRVRAEALRGAAANIGEVDALEDGDATVDACVAWLRAEADRITNHANGSE